MADLPRLALTLIQPWATLVLHHGKDVENRSWTPGDRLRAGARVWIHAGKKLEGDTTQWALKEIPGFAARMAEHDLPRGALVGHVRFDGASSMSTSPWFVGPIGWRISDPVALATPIPCFGALGLWKVPPSVLERAAEDLRG